MRGALRLSVFLPFVLAGCGPVAYAGAVGYDTGAVATRWLRTGLGAQAEAIVYPGGGPLGVGASAQLAGYPAAGGAPMGFATVELRWHEAGPDRSLPYWQLGSGAGGAWTPRVRHLAVPLQLEIGLERPLGGALARVGVRERFLGLVGGGGMIGFNSLQLVLGITTGDGG